MKSSASFCASRLCLLLLTLTVVLASALPAAAFSFTKIADSTNNFTFPENRLPGVNAAGTVTFRGVRSGVEGVFTGSGGSTIAAVATVDSTFSAFGLPAIAADGSVAFSAHLVAGGEGVFRGGSGTVIANGAGELATFGGLVSIGTGGLVVFQATRDDGIEGIFSGTGGAVGVVADTTGEAISAFGLPAVSANGTLVFHGVPTAGGEAIFTAQAGAPVVPVAASGATFSAFGSLPAINATGTVAFQATLAGGGQAILTAAPGAAPVTIASTAAGGYTGFGNVSVNRTGAVAFLATTGGGTGIFTGADSTQHKVIAVGDPLGGSTVTALELGRDGLSDSGQVAFYAELASGVAGVYRGSAANLRVTALTLTPSVGGPGATLSAVATVKNVGSGTAPATTARFYYSSDNVLDAADVEIGSRAVPALASGVEDSQPANVVLPADVASTGGAFVIAKADAANEAVESSEDDNTKTAALKLGPDLRIGNLVAPASTGAGATITVSVTTENPGGGEAPSSVTRLYVSTDNVLDPSDKPVGQRVVPILAGLGSDVGSVEVTLPNDLAGGSYFIIAQADADAQVAESSETNNVKVRSFVIGTDLVVSAFTTPPGGTPGQSITVTDSTKNNAGAPAPASATKFYLSTDNVFDPSDVLLGSRTVPALAGSAIDTATTTLTIPAATAAGKYFLIARADADGAVAETNESNNTSSKAFGIGVDLVVTNFSGPTAAATGGKISISDGTRNTAGGVAPASTTSFYLSTDAVLDPGDTLLGSRPVPPLDVAATDTVTSTLTLPAGVVGNMFLIAKADGPDAITEQNEGNNTTSRAIVIGPDIVVSALTASVAASGSVVVAATVSNTAAVPVEGAFKVAYYLSSDGTWDAGDTLLGASSVTSLAAGAASTDNIALPLPAGAAGTGFIIARADADGTVPETNETNNTTAAAFSAGADLRVNKIAATPTKDVTAGTTLTVTDTVQNAGVKAAGATVMRLYFSVDAVLDAADMALGERAVPELAARASSQGTTQVVIPPGTVAGRYYVIAVADANGAQPESVETNNVATLRLTVK